MADDKIYRPEVFDDSPFPQEQVAEIITPQSTGKDSYKPPVSVEKPFPTKRIATELLSTALNTKSLKITKPFEFTEHGALQIGKHVLGVSGDVRISGAGLVMRNIAGQETIAQDGETGDAVFAGRLQSGTLVTGLISVGDGSIQIDGTLPTPAIRFFEPDGRCSALFGKRSI